ncbi:EPIDERMAL PATTERNING FACTOR-like protein 5 [Musa acuminata AAA Group]|uniref:EPIDERMAL PATTERNING FACTOR-like protein 5 n=1 Tax=Musa acuminata AAA Group TaxID=214697 RepID=UPI0031DDE45C
MGVQRHRLRRLSAVVAVFVFAVALGERSASVVLAQEAGDTGLTLWEKENRVQVLVARRRLGGPGSSPPICRARCGRCLPCRPVHMAIQPGRIFPLEYYPEAWRCKCGGKLFMP